MGRTGRKRLLERFASCCFTALSSLSPLGAMFWYSGAARAVERRPCWEFLSADSGPRLWSCCCPRRHWHVEGLLNCDTCLTESFGLFFELLAVFVEFPCIASVYRAARFFFFFFTCKLFEFNQRPLVFERDVAKCPFYKPLIYYECFKPHLNMWLFSAESHNLMTAVSKWTWAGF